MKFTQFAKSLALVGSASAVTYGSTYSNTSALPTGEGYFLADGSIYYDLTLPNSGFEGFSCDSEPITPGFTLSAVTGAYSNGNPFDLSGDASSFSGLPDFTSSDESLEFSLSGLIASVDLEAAYLAAFVFELEGLPQLINKRVDQAITVTVTATYSPSGSPSGSSSAVSTSTTTGLKTITTTVCDEVCTTETLCPVEPTVSTVTVSESTIVTITSCSDNACTEVPVTTGVTTVTVGTTYYTTYCPLSTLTTYTPSTGTPITTFSSGKPEVHYYTTLTTTTTSPEATSSSSEESTSTSSSSEESTSTEESTSYYEGAGSKVAGSSLFALGAGLVAMML